MIILAQPIFVPRSPPVVIPPAFDASLIADLLGDGGHVNVRRALLWVAPDPAEPLLTGLGSPFSPALTTALFSPDPAVRAAAAWVVEHIIPQAWTYPGYDPAPPGAVLFSGAASPTDTSAAFDTFLNANAGNKIAFVPGRTYKMDSSTQITGLDGWDLYGQGATVTCNVLGSGNQAWLRAVTSDNWRIRDVNLVGPASHQDIIDNWTNFGWAREDWRGLIIDGGNNVRLDRVKAHGFWGDPLYIARRDSSGDPFATPDGVMLVNCDFWDAGRNAVSLTGGINVSVLGCRIGNGGLAAWDTEPNLSTDVTDNVLFAATRFYGGDLGSSSSASHDSHSNGYVVYISAGQAQATDYTMIGCTMDVGAIYCRRESGSHNDGISITGTVADALGDCTFQLTDNITFSGNTNVDRVDL